MRKVSILNALIDGLKGGSSVLIVQRGRPVARLEPVTSGGGKGDDPDGRLSRLIREGVDRPGKISLSPSVLREPPRLQGASSVLAALVEERREDR